jgi:ribosomal protein S18 acetylase RimI-like enzyme
MRLINAAQGIEYGVVEEAEGPAMARLLADTFSRHEPMAVAIGLPRAQLELLVAAFLEKALVEQLAVVARDASTSELLGAVLADDFGTAPPDGLDQLAPAFAPIGALLDGLDDRYRSQTKVSPGTHAHIFMVGVTDGVTSRGIATGLVTACVDNAAQRGYQTAITEATGAASQRVFRKLGFRDLHASSYRHFTYNGEAVFASITDVDGTILMAADL